MVAEEDNITLVKRFLNSCWKDGRINYPATYFSDVFVAHDPSHSEPIQGYEKFVRLNEQFLQAFPVLYVSIENIFASGDKVVIHWVHQGKHQGSLLGCPPTDKEATLEGMAIFRIVDGKIAETWEVAASFQMLQQLDLFPPKMG